MSWKSTLRSIERAGRAMDREAKRQQRELEKRQRDLAKMQALELAMYEEEVFNNYINSILTIHHDCNENIDWDEVQESNPPSEPQRTTTNEVSARRVFEDYSPGIFDKALRRAEDKQSKLRSAIDEAIKQDEEEYQEARSKYEAEYAEWKELRETATRIIEGDTEAYAKAIEHLKPFAELGEYGEKLTMRFDNPKIGVATLQIYGKDVIPTQEKRVLKSGKLSVKDMPKTKYYGIYQDYVCGSVLRVARELFALLPIKAAVVTVEIEIVNTSTGHLEMTPILSVAIPRATLDQLLITATDPSDALSNFVHKMNFKTTKGFFPIEALNPEDLELIQ
jgi:hypothetical protein